MIYLLYNPRSNNDHNDINVILKGKSQSNVTSVNLLTSDVHELLPKLTAEDKVLLCGGDGTISRFATNTYGFEFPCPVCVLKSGTGNDFVRDINENETDKVEQLIDIRQYLKNLPTVEYKDIKAKFINGTGFGLDGEVCREVEEQKKRSNKKASYTAAAIKLILGGGYKMPHARVVIDGVTHEFDDVWLVSTMKGRYYGGGMMVTPDQDRSSDELSVLVFHGGSRVKVLSVFSTVYTGKHVKYKKLVEIFRGKSVHVEFDKPTALQMDGEVETDVLSYTAYMDGCEPCK